MSKSDIAKPERLVTLSPQGNHPAGVVIDVYFIALSGGYDADGRDTWTYYGNNPGDGWWWRVRDPRHAMVLGMFRNAGQITEHLGIDMSAGNLMPVGQRFWPDEKWREEHTPRDDEEAAA
jgi:hypothetical protein